MEYYRKSVGVTKKKILDGIFSEYLVLETRLHRLEEPQFFAVEKEKLLIIYSLIYRFLSYAQMRQQ